MPVKKPWNYTLSFSFYKVGDRVKIREDIDKIKMDDKFVIFAGLHVTIKELSYSGFWTEVYTDNFKGCVFFTYDCIDNCQRDKERTKASIEDVMSEIVNYYLKDDSYREAVKDVAELFGLYNDYYSCEKSEDADKKAGKDVSDFIKFVTSGGLDVE